MNSDTSELRALAGDFGTAARTIPQEARKVVKRAAQNIKTTMVEDAASDGYYQHFSRSISYDMRGNGYVSTAEIGPDKGRTQGALGNILYFGTAKNGPVLDVEVGLRREAPSFERHMAEVATGALNG